MNNKQIEEIALDCTQYVTKEISSQLKKFTKYVIISKQSFFENILNECATPFSSINTEFKLIKRLKVLGIEVSPTKFLISEELAAKTKKGKRELDLIKPEGVIMPIKFQIKKLFEKPGLL